MPAKVTIQNGQFQDAAGNNITGTLVLQLSQDALVSGTGTIVPGDPVSIVVTAGQAVATPIWGNDNLTPSGTTYTATLFDTSGARVWGPETWSITGAGPIELNTLAPSSSNVSYPTAIIKNPSGDQTISTNNLLPAAGNTTQSLGSTAAPWMAELRAVNTVLFADAFSSIQAAHDALPSGGGKIIVPAGTYSASGNVLTISKSNIIIEGVGPLSIIKGTTAVAYPTTTNVIYVSGSNVRITNLAVQGIAIDQTTNQNAIVTDPAASNVEIDHISFSALNVAVYLNGSSNSVHDNVIGQMFGTTNSNGYGIVLDTSSYNKILGNSITFSNAQGRHQIYVSKQSSYNDVGNNVLQGGTNIQIQVYALDAQTTGARYNDIHDNICLNSAGSTGGVISINNNATFNTVRNNIVISSTASHGIALWDAGGTVLPNDNTITDNYVALAGVSGILVFGCNNCLIAGNKVNSSSQSASNTYPGIYIGSDGQTANNNRIIGNFVRGTSHNYAVQILPNAPAPTGTEFHANCFDAGTSGTISDGGSGTIFGVNTVAGALSLKGTTVTGTTGSGAVVFATAPTVSKVTVGSTLVADPGAVSINSSTYTNIDDGTLINWGFYIVRDNSNGGACLILVDRASATPIQLVSTVSGGATTFTVNGGAPTATQIDLQIASQRLQAKGGSSRSGASVLAVQVTR